MPTSSEVHRRSGKYAFICYSHQDIGIVEEEVEWLRRQGFKVWYDDNIATGHAWSEELAEAIAGATAMLYFLSTNSATSAYCMDELHFAKDRQCPVIPIEIEPVNLSPGLHLTLGTKQFIKMNDTSRKVFRNKLASGVSALLVSSKKVQNPPHENSVAKPPGPAPAILKSRLAGIGAAAVTLLVILLVAV